MLEWLKEKYLKATNSISFYSLIIAIALFLSGVLVLIFRDNALDRWLASFIPVFGKTGPDTLRTFLSIIAGGMFSLTIFSFTMVMVVLSQAASTYSPKILDGLLKDKRPQYTLGFHIGSLLFCFPLILNIHENGNSSYLPPTGIMLVAILAIANLFLFIRFIHYVSTSIRPAQISYEIYIKTLARWKTLARKKKKKHRIRIYEQIPGLHNASVFAARKSGYFQGADEKALFGICEKYDLTLQFILHNGDYILDGVPLFHLQSEGPVEKKILSKIYETLFFYNIEDVQKNMFFGYRQLTEVAAKALSPAINDIGTARICIDYLTDLIRLYASEDVIHGLRNNEGQVRIIYRPHSLHELFEIFLDEIRVLGRKDKHINQSLIRACALLMSVPDRSPSLEKEVLLFAQKIKDDLESEKYLDDTNFLLRYFREKLE